MFDSHHPQKGPFVRALQPGERVVAFYLVRRKQMEIFRDKTRGEYLTLSLGDRSGEILARVWERAQELSGDFSQGDVIKVAADVEISATVRNSSCVNCVSRGRVNSICVTCNRRLKRTPRKCRPSCRGCWRASRKRT